MRVKGSRFLPGAYRIKLEGARKIGCRTVSIAGARDLVMLQKIDEVLRGVRSPRGGQLRRLGLFLPLDWDSTDGTA